MPAYVISHVSVIDHDLVEQYRLIAAESIRQYGGRYLARGGKVEKLEGEWPDKQFCMVVEFPDVERARQWYSSPEYREGRELAKDALSREVLIVDGVRQD